jgi:apolipoprotein D and lipocalin family protein
MPPGVKPVSQFELPRYLGTWYEIARLDHSFERGMTHVSATYALRDDGGVQVLNKGYDVKNAQWETAEGKAYFVDNPQTGFLKVSFFGPFYGSYIVFELDHEHYQYAVVSGPDHSYLWILSRTPVMSDEVKNKLLDVIKSRGFDVAKLEFVEQQRPPN